MRESRTSSQIWVYKIELHRAPYVEKSHRRPKCRERIAKIAGEDKARKEKTEQALSLLPAYGPTESAKYISHAPSRPLGHGRATARDRSRGAVTATLGHHLVDSIASTTATDVVHRRLGHVLLDGFLPPELLVEAEHGTLAASVVGVGVSRATTTGCELGRGGGRREFDARCWACGCGSVCEVL